MKCPDCQSEKVSLTSGIYCCDKCGLVIQEKLY